MGLRSLPHQPDRSLHVIVNRAGLLPGLDGRWRSVVPPSELGVKRGSVVTVKLNRPPALLLGEGSFKRLEEAVLTTSAAMMKVLDARV